MSWVDTDNKNYRGKRDRILVSMTESYELHYFVDQYLKTRNYAVTKPNRDVILSVLEGYPAHKPWKRDDLNAYLDQNVSRS